MRIFIVSLSLLFSANVLADVCNRSPEVVRALEEGTGKKCAAIEKADLGEIPELDMSNSSIKALQADDFKDLINLEKIDLSQNSLSELPEHIFDDLKALVSLNLSENNLVTLPENIFINNLQLGGISLWKNKIAYLPDGIFSSNLDMGTIELRKNKQLQQLPSSMASMDLVNLGIDSSVLSNEGYRRLPSKIVDLRIALGNETSLPDDLLHNQTNLYRFAIYSETNSSPITHLPDDFFKGHEKIFILWINGTSIEQLPSSISDLPKLVWLFLQHNKIKSLPSLNNSAKLHRLNVCQNQLTSVPSDLFELPKLEMFYGGGNLFSTEEKDKIKQGFSQASVGVSFKEDCTPE